MFQRCSAVSCGENAGIAVPVTPTEILRNIIAGVTSAIVARVADRRRLRVERSPPAGPSPMPRAP